MPAQDGSLLLFEEEAGPGSTSSCKCTIPCAVQSGLKTNLGILGLQSYRSHGWSGNLIVVSPHLTTVLKTYVRASVSGEDERNFSKVSVIQSSSNRASGKIEESFCSHMGSGNGFPAKGDRSAQPDSAGPSLADACHGH